MVYQQAVLCFFGVAIHPPFDFKTIINRLRVAVVRRKRVLTK